MAAAGDRAVLLMNESPIVCPPARRTESPIKKGAGL